MSRASIYDRLKRRPQSDTGSDIPQQASIRYSADVLGVIDAVAITPAGLITTSELPKASSPVFYPSLKGPDGYGVMVHEVDGQTVSFIGLDRTNGDLRTMRTRALLQVLLPEALEVCSVLPEGAEVDIVVSTPLVDSQPLSSLLEEVTEGLVQQQSLLRWGRPRHLQSGADPHAVLAPERSGGKRFVLWLSADSLLSDAGMSELDARSLLAFSSGGSGVRPAEAACAVLCERSAVASDAHQIASTQIPSRVWRRGELIEHPPRREERDYFKRQRMVALLRERWAEGADEQPPLARFPSAVVIDSMELQGRALEVAGALSLLWPQLDPIEDAVALDNYVGWVGAAMPALMITIALAALSEQEEGLMVSVVEESSTRLWSLAALSSSTTVAGGDQS